MVGHQIQRAQPESPHVFAGEGKALVKDRENLAERQKAKLDQLKSAGLGARGRPASGLPGERRRLVDVTAAWAFG